MQTYVDVCRRMLTYAEVTENRDTVGATLCNQDPDNLRNKTPYTILSTQVGRNDVFINDL